MYNMVIKRIAGIPDGMFGVALWNGTPFALTLERPWLDNQVGLSCIPEGNYTCLRCRNSPDYNYQDSPRFGNTFQVFNVPGRSKILFHKGNIDDDTHGCILLGEQYEFIGRKVAILSSKKGFQEFKDYTQRIDEFNLNIINYY